MSFIDLFAWFILIVLFATGIAVFIAMGVAPGFTKPKISVTQPATVAQG